jgi:hypothetical protein
MHKLWIHYGGVFKGVGGCGHKVSESGLGILRCSRFLGFDFITHHWLWLALCIGFAGGLGSFRVGGLRPVIIFIFLGLGFSSWVCTFPCGSRLLTLTTWRDRDEGRARKQQRPQSRHLFESIKDNIVAKRVWAG